MSVFKSLDERIQAAVAELGINKPTDAQIEVIPRLLARKNTLLVAPTGIGKTEAAILPIFDDILNNKPEGFYCLYVTPLRALNRDMLKRMRWFAERLDITVGVRHGDTTQAERRKQALKPPQILITTPETFQIMMTGKRLKEHMENVHWLVVDEIHELAQDERGTQLSVGMERLKVLVDRDFTRIGLSATVGTPEEVSRFLRGSSKPVGIVNVAKSKKMKIHVQSPNPKKGDEVIADIVHSDTEFAARLRTCKIIVEKHESTLFFVNTRDAAEIIATRFHLWQPDFPMGVHHGSLSKPIRIQMEDEFKAQILKGLICTSSLELGIDVGSADYTIQYNSPRQVSRLVQRIGRAGHKIGQTSRGTIITDNADDIFEAVVISRRALAGELEETVIRENPITVLANQIVAQIMQTGDDSLEDFYKIVTRAYPFRNLAREKFDEIVRQLSDLRIIWLDGDNFSRNRNSRMHFFDNISMIPDERTYLVVDITTRRPIGKLDESFVVAYAEPNAPLIVRGRTWKIVEIQDEIILVEPSKTLGAVPSWVGEEITVPFSIAQEVGRLRRLKNFDDYPIVKDAFEKAADYLEGQSKKHPMATDKKITLEDADRILIINACFGSKVNETLGKLISALLMARLGESVAVSSDPYRVMLQLPRRVNPSMVEEILKTTKPDTLESLMSLYLRRAAYTKWKFVYVAKKFGALKKDADYRSLNMDRLMESFEDTPMFEEAIAKTLHENLDIENTKKVLTDIQSGKIGIEKTGLSPIGQAGLEAKMDMMVPRRPTHAILAALKSRLERERVMVVCMNCHNKFRRSVTAIDERMHCDKCGAVMLAILRRSDTDKVRLLRKKNPTPEEKKEIKNFMKSANLVMTHGKRAVLALAARGVGPGNAAKLLSRLYDDEDEFLAAILAAEVQFARTRRFWD